MKRLGNFCGLLMSFTVLSPPVLATPAQTPPAIETQVPSNVPTPGPDVSETRPESKTAPTPEEIRYQKLAEADRLYGAGQKAEAEKLYREVKAPFSEDNNPENFVSLTPIYDPALLSPAAQVYWRLAQENANDYLATKIIVPLQLLVKEAPEFIPGYLRLAEMLNRHAEAGKAIEILEQATTLHPQETELLKVKVQSLARTEQWLEAALAARQFSLLNPTHPEAEVFIQLAEDNMKKFQSRLRSDLRGNAIANVLTSAVGVAITGSPFAALSGIQTTVMMLRGESGVGESLANAAKDQLKLVKDEDVLEYVNQMGQKLAKVAGREEFNYEFHVVLDEKLNAFALPGGKVFVNAGAIVHSNSEAELAGLIAHELAHAVLSHGFQLVSEGNLLADVTQFIPFGSTLTDLVVLNYSREMERQADILGTRILVAAGYAADGLHNLMVTLEKREDEVLELSWLSTHPGTNERVRYLEKLIQENGYNRYGYEGVTRHAEMKAKLKQMLIEQKKERNPRRRKEEVNPEEE